MDRKQILKMLKDDGWYKVAQKGSHMQFKHDIKPGKITVPYEITKNIELSVKRQAGLK